jgi:hypothetical protein
MRLFHRAAPLPHVNQMPSSLSACDPTSPVIYLSTTSRKRTRGLALFMQLERCKRWCKKLLHHRVAGVYADTSSTHHPGLQRLLGRLAVCHNQVVVVSRLDRIPSHTDVGRIYRLGARVVATSGEQLPDRYQIPEFVHDSKTFQSTSSTRKSKQGGQR